ncbi:hypothetical protein MLD38_029868 [Melastoma candidum]|uniref:Uncharacterized protein n=1 Tax=Melastoma candidum TaxID=119954 RepID=A0ACB9N712_9MYRT|nr:hypothetical protein MLD38_029868 [Melastoma candidum]
MNPPKTPRSMNPAAPGSISHPLVSKVRVVARVRPFLASEIAAKDGNPIPCVSVVDQDGPSTDEVMVHIKDHYTRWVVWSSPL